MKFFDPSRNTVAVSYKGKKKVRLFLETFHALVIAGTQLRDEKKKQMPLNRVYVDFVLLTFLTFPLESWNTPTYQN